MSHDLSGLRFVTILCYNFKNKDSFFCHLRFLEEPITSIETFHFTNGSLKWIFFFFFWVLLRMFQRKVFRKPKKYSSKISRSVEYNLDISTVMCHVAVMASLTCPLDAYLRISAEVVHHGYFWLTVSYILHIWQHKHNGKMCLTNIFCKTKKTYLYAYYSLQFPADINIGGNKTTSKKKICIPCHMNSEYRGRLSIIKTYFVQFFHNTVLWWPQNAFCIVHDL